MESNFEDAPNPWTKDRADMWAIEQLVKKQLKVKMAAYQALLDKALPTPYDLRKEVESFDKRK